MIVTFADQNAFQLALTSGAVPADISGAAARGAVVDGRVFIEFDGHLDRRARSALANLGARSAPPESAPDLRALLCWHQLVPLNRTSESSATREGALMLFEAVTPDRIVELCSEMLRLGNDRLATAALVGDGERAPSRYLVRAVDPPYYTILRAGNDVTAPGDIIAYVQQRPRVWVQHGFTHPLTHCLRPPADRMLLLRAPDQWRLVAEPKFRDIYADLEVRLPATETNWHAADLNAPLQVTLRLARSGDDAPATLWVLRDDAERQVEQLVEHAGSSLIDRLSFAVGTSDDRKIVVLRARPSPHAPPVLVLRGTPMRPYLKLSNLFVPCASRIDPPLRRDVLSRVLADDAKRITWLLPAESDPSTFTPESLPDIAFRPLSDWVDYVLDQERVALNQWVQSASFDFAPFVTHEDVEEASEPRPPRENAPRDEKPRITAPDSRSEDVIEDNEASSPVETAPEPAKPTSTEKHASRKRRELESQLLKAEQRYLQLDAPLDDPQRVPMWRDMARLNTVLKNDRDATVCWSNLIWDRTTDAARISSAWLESENRASNCALNTSTDLERLMRGPVDQTDVTRLAAALTDDALHGGAGDWSDRLHLASQIIRRNEAELPVRVAWLAWWALAKLAGDDVLLLARTRDRVLERLHVGGLQLGVDVPSFIRGNLSGDDRLRSARRGLLGLRRTVHRWIGASATGTKQYADLMLAYGLALSGASADCERLVTHVQGDFSRMKSPRFDQVHRWLAAAFRERISAALAGEPSIKPFSSTLLAKLDGMNRESRYKVDRLRSHSHILEPHERIDPYRRWDGRYGDLVRRQLAELYEACDREALQERLDPLLTQVVKARSPAETESWVLATGLELAPRLGEEYTTRLFALAPSVLDRLLDLNQQARILEKGMLAAAHFDLPEVGRALAARIVAAIHTHQAEGDDDAIRGLLGPALRGLRKLGLRDALNEMMNHIAQLMRRAEAEEHSSADGSKAEDLSNEDLPSQDRRLARLSILLHLASAWLYFGQSKAAQRALDEVRDTLLTPGWEKARASRLARAYIEALADAPGEEALARIAEVLERLPAPVDTYTTSSHYSRLQLDVIDAAVRTLVGEGVAVDPAIRRWLDEDELLVRRRIHRDTRAALAAAGMT